MPKLKGALILNDTLNLSYLGDGYYEFQRHFEGNNWLFNSKGQRVTLPMDTLRYLENQRSNNTPDVKNQHRIASAKSEYKAAFDKMSFPTNQIEQLDTLDIDFMNTYNLIRASNFKNPNLNYNSIEDAEGNISDLDKNILLIEDSLCVVAQPTNNLYIKDNALGFKLFITNNTKNTYLFNTDANQLDILTQAMDKTGEWRNIEHFSYFSCGNGQHTSALDPQKYWLFAAPLYKGSFKTQMRIKVVAGVGELGKEYHTYASNFSHDNSVFYSNTFWGTINPAQLWREIRYSTDSIFDFEKD